MVSVWGRAVAAVFQKVAALPSRTLAADACASSAVTVHPVRGRGAAWVTATGTACGITWPACGSTGAADGPEGRPCKATALPTSRHMMAVAVARDHHLFPPRIFPPSDRLA